MLRTIAAHIPSGAIELMGNLLNRHHFTLKIVPERSSKQGDFKTNGKGDYQITINRNLNKYQFLLTLVHEIAHLITYKAYGKCKPHGKEWKQTFKTLMLPFLRPEIFPDALLPPLAGYLINPRASTGADHALTRALLQYNKNSDAVYIHEIPSGSEFCYKKKHFVKGAKRRTRYECLDLQTKRVYLFNQNATIEPVNQSYGKYK